MACVHIEGRVFHYVPSWLITPNCLVLLQNHCDA
jgi:hypothetical protein